MALGIAAVNDEEVPGLDLGAFLSACPDLELLGCLGRGGMGIVYRARQVRLDRHVAVKLMSPELASDPEFAARFEREARTLARLEHPGIVGVHEFGEAAGVYYLIMELIDGPNLRQLMTQDMDETTASTIVDQIYDALAYAHQRGVVHRDIKPENVLVGPRGTVKIADFGLAKLHQSRSRSSATRTGRILGTPQYMAPEQIREPESVDHRSDIFAIGVVFYEMLTGQLPVGRFPVPSELGRGDAQLDQVVLRALDSNRERRYQTADQLRDELRSQAVDHPQRTQVDEPSRPASDRRMPKSNRRATLGWLSAGLVVAGSAALGAHTLWRPPASSPDVAEVEATVTTPAAGPVDSVAKNRWPAKELAWLAPDLSTVIGLDWAELRQAPLVRKIAAAGGQHERTHKVLVRLDANLDVAEILAYGEWTPADLVNYASWLETNGEGPDKEPGLLTLFDLDRPDKTAIATRDGLILISLRTDDATALQARLDAAPSNTDLRDRVLRNVDTERSLWLAGSGEALPFNVTEAAGEFQVWDGLSVGLRLDFATADKAAEAKVVLGGYLSLLGMMLGEDVAKPPSVEIKQDGQRVNVSGEIEIPDGTEIGVVPSPDGRATLNIITGDEPSKPRPGDDPPQSKK